MTNVTIDVDDCSNYLLYDFMAKKLTVLYDHQMFDLQDYGGISRYFANLILGLKRSKNFKAKLPLVYSTNYYVQNFYQILNNKLGRRLLRRENKRNKWNFWFTEFIIKQANFDIFHATYYNPYFLQNLKKPLIITVHDMIHENYAHLFENSAEIITQKKIVIESADLIIAISEYTKQELIRHYPHVKHKIRVIYHGLPEITISPAQEVLPENFLLYVGDRIAVYKNFMPMIEAIAPLIKQNNLHLICTGGTKFNKQELNLFKKLDISSYLTHISASDALMVQLYQQALSLIYPSLEEGFGLPILEAFRNGCPVACSNTSCLPEIGGNAVSYFDPRSVQSMNQTTLKLIDDPELKISHINKGYERLKEFSFENCLDQTLDCYRFLTKNR